MFVEFGDFFLELGGGVFEFERDGTLVGLGEGGGHQEKAGTRQGEQRDLPGGAARVVGVVMEFVHDDVEPCWISGLPPRSL